MVAQDRGWVGGFRSFDMLSPSGRVVRHLHGARSLLGWDVKLGLVETGSRQAPSKLPSPRRKLEKSQGLVYCATLIILTRYVANPLVANRTVWSGALPVTRARYCAILVR